MLLDIIDVQKYIAACAKRSGVRVSFRKDAIPATNGKVMDLPILNSETSQEDKIKLVQFVKHETAHILLSDFSILEKYKPTGLLMMIDNLLEDHRIDYINDKEYIGDRQNTDEYMRIFERDLKPLNGDVVAPLFTWDAMIRQDLWTVTCQEMFFNMCTDKGKEHLKKLFEGNYGDVLRNIRTIINKNEGSYECYLLAKRILEEVFAQDADGYESPPPSENSSTESSADSSETAEGGEEGEDGESASDKLAYVDFNGKEMMPTTMHVHGGGMNAANYTCGSGKGYEPDDLSKIYINNFVTGTLHNGCPPTRWEGHYARDIQSCLTNETHFANVLRTKLQIISKDRWEYGKKSGKLRNSSLWKVAGGVNDRVFKRQISNNVLDVSIQIIVDASGSMSGPKFAHASAAACLLSNVLSNVLKIPVEIIAFSELNEHHSVFIVKEFDKIQPTDVLVNHFDLIGGNYLCDNVDGESLAWCYHRIKQRTEKRRIMLVLSDGCPCGGRNKGEIDEYTRKVINEIQTTPIELYGIGIMYDMVKEYYKHWAVIEDSKHIEESLISIVDNYIFKG